MKAVVALVLLVALASSAHAFLAKTDAEVLRSMMKSMPGLTSPSLPYKWNPNNVEQEACNWSQVYCTPHGAQNQEQRITRLVMKGMVGGSFPSNLGDLKSLQALKLHQTGFVGPLPDSFSQLTSLEVLEVEGASLRSWPNILPLTKLFYVSIGKVSLDVPVLPDKWATHSGLDELHIYSSDIEGTISTAWESNTLAVLGLSDNKLRGTIPGFVTAYNLQDLRLDNNRFSGNLPASVGRNLWQFNAASNFLSGSIPPGFLLPNTNLRNNSLSGSIPDNYRNNYVEYFDVSHNQLTGTIPPSLVGSQINARLMLLNDNSLTLCPAPPKILLNSVAVCDVENQKGNSACSCKSAYSMCSTGCN
jgi:hypothetical protein